MIGDVTPLHTLQLGDSGSRVVFLHGLFGQGRNWMTIAKGLADKHRITLVDLPNHGRSPWTASVDYLAMAESVAELLRPDDPVKLVGHSMGGKTAMVLALRHPQLVERLVVADISPVSSPASDEFAGYIHAMRALDFATLHRREDADAALTAAVPNPTVRAFLLQNLHREGDGWRWQINLDVLERGLTSAGSWPAKALEDCPPYIKPVLWLAGANSEYVLPEYAEAMREYFPRYRKVVIKDAGHWLHSEQPEVFLQVLKTFFAG